MSTGGGRVDFTAPAAVDLTEGSDLTEPAADAAPTLRPRPVKAQVRRASPDSQSGVRGERCTAKAKGTGFQCKRLVRGGGVCPAHGGNAPQVRRKREERIAVAEAGVIFGGEYASRPPGEVLLAAITDMDAVVQKLKDKIALSGELYASDLEALGVWLDRASRMAKVAIDAGVQERLTQLAEAQQERVADFLEAVFGDLHGLLVAGELTSLQLGDPQVMRVLSARQSELEA